MCSKKYHFLLKEFTFCFAAPVGHSTDNVHSIFYEWLEKKMKEDNKEEEEKARIRRELKVNPCLGSRWSHFFRNAEVLFLYFEYIREFCTTILAGNQHCKNNKIKTIADALEKHDDYYRGYLGLVSTFWIYVLKPTWQIFARPTRLSTTKSNIVKLRSILEELKTSVSFR